MHDDIYDNVMELLRQRFQRGLFVGMMMGLVLGYLLTVSTCQLARAKCPEPPAAPIIIAERL